MLTIATRALTPRLFALAALSLAPHVAQAQLPPPAIAPSAKKPAKPAAPKSSAAPARHEQKAPTISLPAPALPAPALPAPAPDAPEVPAVDQALDAAQAQVPATAEPTPEVPEAEVQVDAPQPEPLSEPSSEAVESDSGVIIVPQDATEFPSHPSAPQTKTKPKAPAKPKKLTARVGGVDVSGGTEAAALAKLQKEHGNRLSQPVVLRLGAREFWSTRAELGASLPLPVLLRAARLRARPSQPAEVALRYELEDAAALKYLQKIAPLIRREPQPIGDGATGRAGEELSLGGSLARVKAAVAGGGTEVELLSSAIPFVPKPQPKVEVEVVSSGDARFPIVLADYSTRYNARLSDRTENLRISAREVNGTILQPGEVFSANASIGPRSTSRGFRAAHIFMGKKVVDGVGGGICQCATTVYNAALEAKLPIVERHSHSQPVSYATPQNDATIYWGQKDMKFRNNTNAPIMVRTFLKDGRFHAQILGARPATAVPTVRP